MEKKYKQSKEDKQQLADNKTNYDEDQSKSPEMAGFGSKNVSSGKQMSGLSSPGKESNLKKLIRLDDDRDNCDEKGDGAGDNMKLRDPIDGHEINGINRSDFMLASDCPDLRQESNTKTTPGRGRALVGPVPFADIRVHPTNFAEEPNFLQDLE